MYKKIRDRYRKKGEERGNIKREGRRVNRFKVNLSAWSLAGMGTQ